MQLVRVETTGHMLRPMRSRVREHPPCTVCQLFNGVVGRWSSMIEHGYLENEAMCAELCHLLSRDRLDHVVDVAGTPPACDHRQLYT